jgi:hypothetical protein
MPKFAVYAAVTCSAFTLVEADTPEAALEIANGRGVMLGGIGSGADPKDTFVIEDADGEPDNIRIE